MSGPMQQPASWDNVAEGYAEEVVPQFASYAEEALRVMAPAADAEILDVATGPGTLALLAAPRVARVVAVDFSPGMIDQVRARAARENVANLEAAVMDAQGLALADGRFDAAYCLFALMFIPDRARAFAEMLRVLRPGGRALVATWSTIDRRPFMSVGFQAMAEALPDLPPMPKGDLQDPDECVREMSAAGFRDVEARRFNASYRVESAEQYVRLMERAGAPIALLRKQLGEGWHAVAARLLENVRRRLDELGPDLAAEAILTSGTR